MPLNNDLFAVMHINDIYDNWARTTVKSTFLLIVVLDFGGFLACFPPVKRILSLDIIDQARKEESDDRAQENDRNIEPTKAYNGVIDRS